MASTRDDVPAHGSEVDDRGTAARLLCEQVIAQLKRNEDVSQEVVDQCNRAHWDFYERLCTKNGTRTNTLFSAEDRFEFYLSAMRMSVIFPEEHGGWPIRAHIRQFVLDDVKKQLHEREDPFLLFCAIFPALISDQYDYALNCYRRLEQLDGQWAYAVRDTLRDGCALRDNPDRDYSCGYHEGYSRLLEAVTPRESVKEPEVPKETAAAVEPKVGQLPSAGVSSGEVRKKGWWRLW